MIHLVDSGLAAQCDGVSLSSLEMGMVLKPIRHLPKNLEDSMTGCVSFGGGAGSRGASACVQGYRRGFKGYIVAICRAYSRRIRMSNFTSRTLRGIRVLGGCFSFFGSGMVDLHNTPIPT